MVEYISNLHANLLSLFDRFVLKFSWQKKNGKDVGRGNLEFLEGKKV